MICDKCNGRGFVANPRAYQMSDVVAWERGYTEPIKCSRCGGSGFLLGNAQEVMGSLNVHIKNKIPFTMREMKQLKIILLK